MKKYDAEILKWVKKQKVSKPALKEIPDQVLVDLVGAVLGAADWDGWWEPAKTTII